MNPILVFLIWWCALLAGWVAVVLGCRLLTDFWRWCHTNLGNRRRLPDRRVVYRVAESDRRAYELASLTQGRRP